MRGIHWQFMLGVTASAVLCVVCFCLGYYLGHVQGYNNAHFLLRHMPDVGATSPHGTLDIQRAFGSDKH